MLMLEIGPHQNQDSTMTFLSDLPSAPERGPCASRQEIRQPRERGQLLVKSHVCMRSSQALARGLKRWMV